MMMIRQQPQLCKVSISDCLLSPIHISYSNAAVISIKQNAAVASNMQVHDQKKKKRKERKAGVEKLSTQKYD